MCASHVAQCRRFPLLKRAASDQPSGCCSPPTHNTDTSRFLLRLVTPSKLHINLFRHARRCCLAILFQTPSDMCNSRQIKYMFVLTLASAHEHHQSWVSFHTNLPDDINKLRVTTERGKVAARLASGRSPRARVVLVATSPSKHSVEHSTVAAGGEWVRWSIRLTVVHHLRFAKCNVLWRTRCQTPKPPFASKKGGSPS